MQLAQGSWSILDALLGRVSRETEQRLKLYLTLLQKWQASINLVAPSTMSDAWERHIVDSLQFYFLHPNARHWIDIGSGGGFPGLVTAICLAEKSEAASAGCVELIESNGKKCAFLKAVVRETGLRESGLQIHVHQSRIENALPRLERPDIISARALSSLDQLLSMTSCHLRDGAIGLFAKGRQVEDEVEEAKKSWRFDVTTHPSVVAHDSSVLEIKGLEPL